MVRASLLIAMGWLVAQTAFAVELRLPTITARPGTRVEAPITVGDLTGLNVTGFHIRIAYDAERLTAVGTESRGTIGENWLTLDRLMPGEVWFVMANANPAVGSGVVVRLVFDVKPGASGDALLRFTRADVNDGHVPSEPISGKIAIEAASVDVTGDGVVDRSDLEFIARRFGEATADGDINGDGIVDIVDLVRIARRFGERL